MSDVRFVREGVTVWFGLFRCRRKPRIAIEPKIDSPKRRHRSHDDPAVLPRFRKLKLNAPELHLADVLVADRRICCPKRSAQFKGLLSSRRSARLVPHSSSIRDFEKMIVRQQMLEPLVK